MGVSQSKESRDAEEQQEKDLKNEVKLNLKRLFEGASEYDNIFIQFLLSEKVEEKQAFLSSKIFNKRSDIDKPFEVQIKHKVDVIVIPVGSRVEGTYTSRDSDFDYLLVLDIKSDKTLQINSKSDTDPCLLDVNETDFPSYMRKRVFKSINESYIDIRRNFLHTEQMKQMLQHGASLYKSGWLNVLFTMGIYILESQFNPLDGDLIYSNKNPEENGPASTFEFICLRKIGYGYIKFKIDLVPAVLVNNTHMFMHSRHFTNNKCIQSAFLDIGSFFVTQRKMPNGYIGAFNLSELKLMDRLRSNNPEAYDAYKALKAMKLGLPSRTDEENLLSSYVLKTVLLQLVTDESFGKMSKSEIVKNVLNKLRDVLDEQFLKHLWFPGQNLFAFKKHILDQKERLKRQIDKILEKGKLPSKL